MSLFSDVRARFQQRLWQPLGEGQPYQLTQSALLNRGDKTPAFSETTFPETLSEDWFPRANHELLINESNPSEKQPAKQKKQSTKARQGLRWQPLGPASIDTLADEIIALEQHTLGLHQRKDEAVNTRQQLELEISQICQRIRELRELRQHMSQDEQKEVSRLDEIHQRMVAMEQSRSDLQNQEQSQLAEIEQLREQNQLVQEQYQDLIHKKKIFEKTLERGRALLEKRQQDLAQLRQTLLTAQQSLTEQRLQLEHLQQLNQQIQEQIERVNEQKTQLQARRRELRYQRHALRQQINLYPPGLDEDTFAETAHWEPIIREPYWLTSKLLRRFLWMTFFALLILLGLLIFR